MPTIRAVAFQHGGVWVAQCLDYDIATQATTLADVMFEVQRILVAHILHPGEGHAPFVGIPQAPQEFWDLYQRAKASIALVEPATFPKLPPEQQPTVELRAAA